MGLSPEAFIVKSDGTLRAGVFGLLDTPMLASARDRQLRKTALGGLKRVAYLSPEQTHLDPTLGPSSDIFSLGVVLYELLTCLLYTSPSPRDKRQYRMPSSA